MCQSCCIRNTQTRFRYFAIAFCICKWSIKFWKNLIQGGSYLRRHKFKFIWLTVKMPNLYQEITGLQICTFVANNFCLQCRFFLDCDGQILISLLYTTLLIDDILLISYHRQLWPKLFKVQWCLWCLLSTSSTTLRSSLSSKVCCCCCLWKLWPKLWSVYWYLWSLYPNMP